MAHLCNVVRERIYGTGARRVEASLCDANIDSSIYIYILRSQESRAECVASFIPHSASPKV